MYTIYKKNFGLIAVLLKLFGGHIYFRGPRCYTINLWLCCGGW